MRLDRDLLSDDAGTLQHSAWRRSIFIVVDIRWIRSDTLTPISQHRSRYRFELLHPFRHRSPRAPMDTPRDMTSATRMKLLPDAVEELGGYLDTVPPRQQHSTREAVRLLMPKIMELQKKGYSIADIAVVIQERGFDLPVNTFRAYVGMEKRKREDSGIAGVRSEQASPVKATDSHLTTATRRRVRERRDRKRLASMQTQTVLWPRRTVTTVPRAWLRECLNLVRIGSRSDEYRSETTCICVRCSGRHRKVDGRDDPA